MSESARLLFCSPVTGEISSTTNPFCGQWFDATGFATYYIASGSPANHTGADLNLSGFADSGKPVYAAADGVVRFAGRVPGWQADVVVIEHLLEDGSKCWTRYAHIVKSIALGASVKRGDQIGTIADYNKDGPRSDHLHFDVSVANLGVRPGDWPGRNLERLLRDYVDPAKWLKDRAA